jgi:hypothetical protein
VGKDFLSKWCLYKETGYLYSVTSDKADFKNISQKRQRKSLQIDKGNNYSVLYNNYKHIYWTVSKANTTGHKRTDRHQVNNSGWL